VLFSNFFRKRNKDPFISRFYEITGIRTKNIAIYKQAFSHKSAGKKYRIHISHNERLEYLGDAVLGSIVANYLYLHFKNKDEGFLTKIRSNITNRKTLEDIALKMGFKKLLISGNQHYFSKSIYGNALEAFIGALFIDKGYDKADKYVVERIVKPFINIYDLIHEDTDYKSKVIEWAQKQKRKSHFNSYEKYTDLNKVSYFESILSINDEKYGEGIAKSKKEAEQLAAEMALKVINCQITFDRSME